MSSSEQRTLRWGILADSFSFEDWEAKVLATLISHPNLHLELVIFNKQPTSAGKVSRFLAAIQELLSKPQHLCYYVHRAFLFRPKSARRICMRKTLQHVPHYFVTPHKKGQRNCLNYFDASDLAPIREAKLDFLMRFGFGILRGKLLRAARYGIWSFHHGDYRAYRGSPPVYWEVLAQEPQVGFMLQRLTNKLDAGIPMKEGHVSTARGNLASITDSVRYASIAFAAEVVEDILMARAHYLVANQAVTAASIRSYPSNRAMLALLWQQWISRREHTRADLC